MNTLAEGVDVIVEPGSYRTADRAFRQPDLYEVLDEDTKGKVLAGGVSNHHIKIRDNVIIIVPVDNARKDESIVSLKGSGKICFDKLVPTDDEMLVSATNRIDNKLLQMQIDEKSAHPPGDTCECDNCTQHRSGQLLGEGNDA